MFPDDLSNILLLKKGEEERRPLSLGEFSLDRHAKGDYCKCHRKD